MNHLDLFSGIGGFSLAAKWCGFNTIGFSEIDDYACKILEKNFKGIKNYGDIKKISRKTIDQDVDIITGGFPCQPFSVAGKKKGRNDGRDLWPEMFRVICEFKPTWVIGENVAGFINMELERTCIDLDSQGYEVQPIIIPACAVNAWHRRDRVWIIAYSEHNGRFASQKRQSMGKGNDNNKERAEAGEQFTRLGSQDALFQNARCTLRERGEQLKKNEGENKKQNADQLERSSKVFTNPQSWEQWVGNQPNKSIWKFEPDMGRIFDGLPKGLDRYYLNLSHEAFTVYGNETNQRLDKILQNLFNFIEKEEIQWDTGRLLCFSEKKVLQSFLCWSQKEIDKTRVLVESKKTLEEKLRSLWNGYDVTSPSHRPRYYQQSQIKYPNSLQEVSRLLAQYSKEAWYKSNGEDGLFIPKFNTEDELNYLPRVANGVSKRVDRLKCLGNAIVPQVAFEIMCLIKNNV